MSSFALRWPVVISSPIAPEDRGADGRLHETAVARVVDEARAAYFARCRTVDPSAVDVRECRVTVGDTPVGAAGVTVSINVVEVFPDAFTMRARIRPADGDGVAATASCLVSPGGAVPAAMRDEFIALAQSAHLTH